ncbi:hypothetical protein CN520_23455 [Bacillus cereus]|uniref:hypothetical protein n=1 Tax=Bacillus cereus TaxID=1396 RepID=UPI000BEB630C|nr:hypothetical protein [Bacillus cereus]PDZ39142.1 hypothetical protein CON18_17410 [Bacillus cereus]PET38144.1 hypothetical protein CN520_23455 [Bacillus cereus]PFA19741.1 hypothetical protein CN377_01655 [Bacillus cereus]PFS75827.1 hypothetical protein COK49_16925 [Bacillus cereus]PGP94747.1 hypothetical protein COA10_27935 [Bacillus cereus]
MKTVVRNYSNRGKSNPANDKGLPFAVTGETVPELIKKTNALLERGYDFKTQFYQVIETRRNENVGLNRRRFNQSSRHNSDVGIRTRMLKELMYYECMMIEVN